MHSVALLGLSFVNALVPGVSTPVCILSHLDFVDLWFGAFPRTTIILNTILSFLLLLLPVRCSLVQRLLITQ